jgi:DNA-binding response OmpR family regulator
MSYAEPIPVGSDVAVLRWPDDEHLRPKLEQEGHPRVLIVAALRPAPEIDSELEDWMREPIDLQELQTRADTLRIRAHQRSLLPRLDDHGLVRVGTRWVAIPDAQLPVVALLLARIGRLVELEQIVEVYTGHGNSGHRTAISAVMNRLTTRLREVGLDLHVVRGRGYVLDVAAELR